MSDLYALMRTRAIEDDNDELVGLFDDREKALTELTNSNLYVLKLQSNKVYSVEYWDENPEIEVISPEESVYSLLP